MANREFKKWLKEAILRMRISYSDLTKEQKSKCPVRFLCIKPLQISALWIKRISSAKNRPFIKNQILLIGYRFKDVKDLSIEVSVGEEIIDDKFEYAHTYDFSSIFSGIRALSSSSFRKSLNKKKKIEKIVIEFLRDPRIYANPIIIRRKPMVFVWSYEADLSGSVEKWFEKNEFYFFEHLRREIVNSSNQIKTTATKKAIESVISSTVSTFFYPAIWIGELPKFPFEHRVLNSPTAKARKIFEDVYGNRQIFIKQNGKIIVVSQDTKKALEIFNNIFALAFYLGLEAYPVGPQEIAVEAIHSDTLDGISGRLPVGIDRFISHEYFEHYSIDEVESFRKVKLSQIKYIFKVLKKIKNSSCLEMIKYLHESHTMFYSGFSTASLLFSWIILERFLHVMWFKLSRVKRLSANKWKESLKNWEVSKILVTLKMSKVINKKEYMLLDEFRKIRNDIIHGDNEKLREATATEAWRAYNLAFKFVDELMYRNIGKIKSIR